MIKFYLDTNNDLHIVHDRYDTIPVIPYGEWIGFTKNDLETVDEWFGDIDGLPKYNKADFVEIASDEDGFVKEVLLREKTVKELLNKISK